MQKRLAWKHAGKAVKIELILLCVLAVIAGIVMRRYYVMSPGIADRDSFIDSHRGTEDMDLTWEPVRNTEKYVISYKNINDPAADWTEVEVPGSENTVRIEGLEQGSTYMFTLRPDSAHKQGFTTMGKPFSTKKKQKLKTQKVITKLTSSKPFRIDVKAKTKVTYRIGDTSVAKLDKETGEIIPKRAGTTDIVVRAVETEDFVEASVEVKLRVLPSDPVDSGGASTRIIYHLDSSNCEVVKAVTGDGSIHVPQGLAYTGDKYIIAYGMAGSQRIITFDVDGGGKSIDRPDIALGHPNGFTYCDETGLCYCVKGWSGRAVTYSPETGSYGVVRFPYGCSGIGYDREKKWMYTSSRTAMVAYDMKDGISVAHRTGVVRHSGGVYTQDCGGYGGIMLHCLSGRSKHGTNYIDMYDMINGKYLGTFSCDLSEVESVIVDEDGFLEILANNSGRTDYIWKTEINIGTIAEGL